MSTGLQQVRAGARPSPSRPVGMPCWKADAKQPMSACTGGGEPQRHHSHAAAFKHGVSPLCPWQCIKFGKAQPVVVAPCAAASGKGANAKAQQTVSREISRSSQTDSLPKPRPRESRLSPAQGFGLRPLICRGSKLQKRLSSLGWTIF